MVARCTAARISRSNANYSSVGAKNMMMGMDSAAPSDAVGELIGHSAIEEAFERHFDDIYRFAYRRVGRESAEEVASETFARALGRLPTFDERRGSLRGWLFGIASNVIREHEYARLRASTHPLPNDDSTESAIDQMVDRLGESARVGAVLELLTPQSSEILLLVAGLGLTYQEAAEALGIPIGTVRSRLSMARRQFSRALRRIDSYTRNEPR
jgi:RNA polymerase sigma factor (sigma-70 family)